MGNFGGLTAFYVRMLASRCMPAEPAPARGVQGTLVGQRQEGVDV